MSCKKHISQRIKLMSRNIRREWRGENTTSNKYFGASDKQRTNNNAVAKNDKAQSKQQFLFHCIHDCESTNMCVQCTVEWYSLAGCLLYSCVYRISLYNVLTELIQNIPRWKLLPPSKKSVTKLNVRKNLICPLQRRFTTMQCHITFYGFSSFVFC